MRYLKAVLVLLLSTSFLTASSLSAQLKVPTNCTTSPADEPKVTEAMRQFYVALTNDDLPLFRSVIASNFYAYDGGTRFEGDALVTLIKASHAKGNVYVWAVTEPQVHLTCDTAWISFINKGSVITAGSTTGPQPRTWVESAIMQKEAGVWKIQFFHSTPVRQP